MGLSNFHRALPLCHVGIVLLLCIGCGDTRTTREQSLSGQTMGTYYRITALCAAADLQPQAEKLLARINGDMSNYDANSTLSRFNRSEVGSWFVAPDELLFVMRAAVDVHDRSAGAFDVTVAPLLALWGFGPQAAADLPPGPNALDEARQRIGMHHIELDARTSRLRRLQASELDLSALAKGYGVDALSDMLLAQGCADHLVDIGGEIRARGSKAGGAPWRIGIEVPDPETRGGVQRVVELRDHAVATSGDYRNFVQQGDSRWSHTLDPRTGKPVEHGLASVTVVHESAMLADAWATALNVVGPDAALAMAQREKLAVLLIVHQADGFSERYNEAFATLLAP